MILQSKKYPTQEDIDKHTKQFVAGLYNYLLLGGRIDFVKNDLRCLFTDLVLNHQNNKTCIYNGKEDFDKFIMELAK